MYQPEYHRKPEGQVIVQTFHGYPFKQMGHPHWRALQFSQARIDCLRRARRRVGLPASRRRATPPPLLTREFDYQGEVLEIGYPRNDVLQSRRGRRTIRAPDAGSRSASRDGQTAVLYAPTFRDYLAEQRQPGA